ncbi:MAG: dodecin domain-containing protein [Bacteroidales bacterium]|nr:dodecin domain-containing protein [Bacteroidales bacterium]
MENSVYKVIEIIGSSSRSWDDAATNAVAKANKTLDDLRIAEVVSMDMKVENGKVSAYRTKLRLSFKFKSD